MKLFWCLKCGDIRSMNREGKKTECECGNITARWFNPQKGTVRVQAEERHLVRFIGIHNGMLEPVIAGVRWPHEAWREQARSITANSPGYLFDDSKRGCPMVIIRVGESNDIHWEDDPNLPENRPTNG